MRVAEVSDSTQRTAAQLSAPVARHAASAPICLHDAASAQRQAAFDRVPRVS
jgi:hypothetical protein